MSAIFKAVAIDGGASRVEIKGSGLAINAANCTVRGLVLNSGNPNGVQPGINLNTGPVSGGNCFVEGNYFGTDVSGSSIVGTNLGNAVGIDGSNNNTVGGTASAARNIIAGFDKGISIGTSTSASANAVQGNYIGTDFSGAKALGNTTGVVLSSRASNNTIGGTSAGARNIISGNKADPVDVNGSNNLVQGNYIGTDVNGIANVEGGNIHDDDIRQIARQTLDRQ